MTGGPNSCLFTIFYESPEHPKQGMQPENCEGTDQQARHADESPVKQWVFLLIRVLAMGIKSGKRTGGIFMTLPAC